MANIAFELDHEQEPVARVKVVGVGGAGGNAIQRMIESGLSRVEFIAINTDDQVLQRSSATTQICIGGNVTRGLGAGGDPKVGREAVEEDRERLAGALAGSDMVFITAGMGGGTGTGASPVIAELARDMGALTVGVVTTPFRYEGPKRRRRASGGLAELSSNVDTLIVISNERLLEVLPGETPLRQAFGEADNVLLRAVQGITDIILVPGLVNLDFADVRAVMAHRGNATMGAGTGVGGNRARDSALEAISNPLLEDVSIRGAMGLLVNITASPALSQEDVNDVMEAINDEAGDGADTYVGVVLDEGVPEDEIRITLIATGFDRPVDEQRSEGGGQDSSRIDTAETPRELVQRPKRPPPADDISIPAFQRGRQQTSHDRESVTEPSVSDSVAHRGGLHPTADAFRLPAFMRRKSQPLEYLGAALIRRRETPPASPVTRLAAGKEALLDPRAESDDIVPHVAHSDESATEDVDRLLSLVTERIRVLNDQLEETHNRVSKRLGSTLRGDPEPRDE